MLLLLDDKKYMLRKTKRTFDSDAEMYEEFFEETKTMTERERKLWVAKEMHHYSPALVTKICEQVGFLRAREAHLLQASKPVSSCA